ncbi:hypothetical protein CsSME_00021116 [Camellia sinensis var. sinensis]
MRPPSDPGGPGPPWPGPGPGPPAPFIPGGFCGGFVNNLCSTISSCFYFVCCCWLLQDCFGDPPGPPSGPPGPPLGPPGPPPPPPPPPVPPRPPGSPHFF